MMVKADEVAQALQSLVSDDSSRSETARLREIFKEVEELLDKGVRREAVLAMLHTKGFKMTMSSFKSALQRIRKEKRESA
jgi:hypothetical protein